VSRARDRSENGQLRAACAAVRLTHPVQRRTVAPVKVSSLYLNEAMD